MTVNKLVALLLVAHEPSGYDLFGRVGDGEKFYVWSYDSKADCDQHASRANKTLGKLAKIIETPEIELSCEPK